MIGLRRGLRNWLWRPISRITGAFHLLPPLAVLVVCLMLTAVGQIRELYLSYLEEPGFLRVVCAAMGFGLMSWAVFVSHFLLNPVHRDIVYANPAELPHSVDYAGFRKYTAWILAYLPWLGLAGGLHLAYRDIADITKNLASLTAPFVTDPVKEPAPRFAQTLADMNAATSDLEFAVSVAIPSVLVTGALTILLLDRILRRSREDEIFKFAWRLLVGLLVFIVAAGLLPKSVALYRTLGPFATLAVSILFLFSIAALLAHFARETRLQTAGFPALTLALVAIGIGVYAGVPTATIAWWMCIVAFGVAGLAVFLRIEPPVIWLLCMIGVLAFGVVRREANLFERLPAESAAQQTPPRRCEEVSSLPGPGAQNLGARNLDLERKFLSWLNCRHDRPNWPLTDGKMRYPVFIIAAEGGGIYAAAAASAVLARLQDQCPGFAQHVFAISAVSGGAIGATAFQAHVQPLPQSRAGCDSNLVVDGPLQKKLAAVMIDDHFSPVVGSIVADLIGQKWDRAEGLAESFSKSVWRHDEAVGKLVDQPYADHWRPARTAPALVLNATWAETGDRVAFSPFRLCGEAPVYTFADRNILGPAANQKKLMEAAVVSARFPGILPPFAVLRRAAKAAGSKASGSDGAAAETATNINCVGSSGPPVAKPDGGPSGWPEVTELRWNFVDGGYSDPSGAASALDIYRALRTSDAVVKNQVDLTLILLTGVSTEPNFEAINGTAFRDLVAPIDAILNVRSQLSGQYVARTVNYFNELHDRMAVTAGNPNDDDPRRRLKVIHLPDETFKLPLGWKISRSTFDLVSLLVGRTDLCVKLPDKDIRKDNILYQNSCVLRDIKDALTVGSPK